MKKILYTLAAAATLLTACNKDEGVPEASDNVPVQFSTAITRAPSLEWGNSDEIGVFMMNNGTPLTTARLADNVKYTNSASGFITTTPIYYPPGSGTVDFVAYYPYKASFGTPYTYIVDVSNQTTPADIDLLYSDNAKNKNRSRAAVKLDFNHKLSKVVLNVKKGAGVTDLTSLAVHITGMPTKANFALATGTFSDEGTPLDLTPIAITAASGYEDTYSAIVIPQEASVWSGRKLVFTLGGQTYTYAISDADDFVSGMTQQYNITIKKSGVTVSRGKITDWNTTTPEVVDPIQLPAMVLIPKGTFQMGSPGSDEQAEADEKPQHWVRLTKDFYMSKYQVTNAQYAAFLNANSIGSDGKWALGKYSNERLIFAHSWGLKWDNDKWVVQTTGYDNFPIIDVTWYGAKAFADWIGGSLPTEAQWEYACRAGSTTPYSFGTNSIDDYAWYQGNSGAKTHEVGKKLPNAWGLYDMHGNVYEWCLDQWDGNNNYPTTATEANAVENPLVSTGSSRVLRGGSWHDDAQFCRSAYRININPDFAYNSFGFRVVLVP